MDEYDHKNKYEDNSQHQDRDLREQWWQPAIYTFLRLSVWIIFPVLLGIYIGKWLDQKYYTEPWLFLLSVGMAFFISMFGIVRNTLKEYAKIEKEEKQKKNNQNINNDPRTPKRDN